MDILAHGLWAGLAVEALNRSGRLDRRALAATVALAVLPDVPQLLPLLIPAAVTDAGWTNLLAYATASPGQEPAMSTTQALLSHHLHCMTHSALVAAAVSALVWMARHRFWWPLLGWWSHILIDVFTHSSEFYPSPVFYPLTYWGFDGIAWNTPWFMALNYGALAFLALLLWRRRIRRRSFQKLWP